MAQLSSIMLDLDKVEGGRECKHPSGVVCVIANIHSRPYREAREAALKPFVREIRSGAMTNEQISEKIKPVVAKHLLLGWKNLTDEAGNEIPYSPEKASQYFNDPAFAAFYAWVLDEAGETAAYHEQVMEDGVKNSVMSSGGTSNGAPRT